MSLLIFCTCLVSACFQGTTTQQKHENVVRVYWHEGAKFSFAVENPETKEITMKSLGGRDSCLLNGARILQDVPVNQKMWIRTEVLHNTSSCDGQIVSIEIHTHSFQDIEGGSWDRGKLGRGITQVIQ